MKTFTWAPDEPRRGDQIEKSRGYQDGRFSRLEHRRSSGLLLVPPQLPLPSLRVHFQSNDEGSLRVLNVRDRGAEGLTGARVGEMQARSAARAVTRGADPISFHLKSGKLGSIDMFSRVIAES